MSDTNSDVVLSSAVFTDLNDETGIAAGVALIITNKSTNTVLLQVQTAQPSADSTDGIPLAAWPNELSTVQIPVSQNAVWAKALNNRGAFLSVQENP